MRRILFLDLEGTIIDTFETGNLTSNHKVIKEFIKDNDFDEVHLFSFAIYGDKDITTFNDACFRGWLENTFDIVFNDAILSVDKIMKICNTQLKINMNREDFFDFMKKDIAFRLVCEADPYFKECDCFLLDDMVKNTSLFVDNRIINTINVTEFK